MLGDAPHLRSALGPFGIARHFPEGWTVDSAGRLMDSQESLAALFDSLAQRAFKTVAPPQDSNSSTSSRELGNR